MISRTLTKGCTGSDVSQLESKLKSLGFYTGNIDGSFGPYLKEAVILYQRSKRLVQDGIAGPITLTSLGLWGVPVPTPRSIVPTPIESSLTVTRYPAIQTSLPVSYTHLRAHETVLDIV